MGIGHGDEAVVELVFVVALNYKAILNGFLAVGQHTFRDNAYGESIDLTDALILTWV